MTHLYKITAGRTVETVAWDENADAFTQIYAALSTDTIKVSTIERVPSEREDNIEMWADEDAEYHGAPLNFYASSYAGTPLLGTVALVTHKPYTSVFSGLTETQIREEEDRLIRAVTFHVARLGAVASL
ncbi:hypothetical protein [Brachybacterium kimchii]|uniref:GAF domain-containing protein n=1 Tax=Brachybacterium kimchii TaxID=2942909 RepID=A0ABY4NDT4_9MICO|nr:hypothetical protein [Brachybacterium kimchii]UQN31795.1 hypothetical protein M4486_19590 [Brachybacterium kimchii]